VWTRGAGAVTCGAASAARFDHFEALRTRGAARLVFEAHALGPTRAVLGEDRRRSVLAGVNAAVEDSGPSPSTHGIKVLRELVLRVGGQPIGGSVDRPTSPCSALRGFRQGGPAMEGLIRLEEVVDTLRTELKALQWKAGHDGESLRFSVEEVEPEFQLVVTKGAEGEGKVNVYVAELGGKGIWSKENTQAIRLKLKPVRPTEIGR
jgi:hypothetical protein